MGGLQGIDWPSARLLCDPDEPWAEIIDLLRSYERGALEGARRKAERDRDNRNLTNEGKDG